MEEAYWNVILFHMFQLSINFKDLDKEWNNMLNISVKSNHFNRINKTFMDSTKIYNCSKAMVGYFQFINFIVTLRSKYFYWSPRILIVFQSSRKYKLKLLKEIRKKKLTGLLPVPTGSLSSSVGGGKLWKAQIFDRHSNHLLAFSAIHAP